MLQVLFLRKWRINIATTDRCKPVYPHNDKKRGISTSCPNIIMKTRLFNYQKLKIFRWKNSDIFQISAQNIDCGYSLEPLKNKENNVYPCKPLFYYTKVGFKGSKFYRHVFMIFSLQKLGTLYMSQYSTIDGHYGTIDHRCFVTQKKDCGICYILAICKKTQQT